MASLLEMYHALRLRFVKAGRCIRLRNCPNSYIAKNVKFTAGKIIRQSGAARKELCSLNRTVGSPAWRKIPKSPRLVWTCGNPWRNDK
jgi:hypothetical protein